MWLTWAPLRLPLYPLATTDAFWHLIFAFRAYIWIADSTGYISSIWIGHIFIGFGLGLFFAERTKIFSDVASWLNWFSMCALVAKRKKKNPEWSNGPDELHVWQRWRYSLPDMRSQFWIFEEAVIAKPGRYWPSAQFNSSPYKLLSSENIQNICCVVPTACQIGKKPFIHGSRP